MAEKKQYTAEDLWDILQDIRDNIEAVRTLFALIRMLGRDSSSLSFKATVFDKEINITVALQDAEKAFEDGASEKEPPQ